MAYTPVDYNTYDFATGRHIGPSPSEMEEMLKAVVVASLDELMDQTIPASIQQKTPLGWTPLAEHELLEKMRQVAAKNRVMTSLIGQGYYGTVTPPAIQRNILENPAWYTAYTPYQPEIAQGRLEALLNYQTMVIDLTGLDIANASLLDEATAAAEAMTMAQRVAKSKATAFFVDENCHPQNIAVMRTRAAPLGDRGDRWLRPTIWIPRSCSGPRSSTPAPMAMCATSPTRSPDCGSTQRFGVPTGHQSPWEHRTVALIPRRYRPPLPPVPSAPSAQADRR